jgi:hypothetical protein
MTTPKEQWLVDYCLTEKAQNPEVQTHKQFVRSWESWVGNQANSITRCLLCAAKKRSREKVSGHQLALFSIEVPPDDAVP